MNERGSLGAQPHGIEVVIDPSIVLRILLWIIGLLVALSTATQAVVRYLPDFPLRDSTASLFYIDFERSLPTLYSTMLLFVSALLFATIASGHRRAGHSYVGMWRALSLAFSLLALDEFAELHGLATERVGAMLDIEAGPFWFAWVVPTVAVALFGLAFARFMGHLPRATRRRMSSAGILFVGGAIGVELLGAWYSRVVHGLSDFTYVLFVTVEESLEMVGSALLVYTLLAYVPVGLPGLVWRVWVIASD